MDKDSVKTALSLFKKTVYLSKIIKTVNVIEKAVLISAAVLTAGELIMIFKKMK